MKRNYMSLVIGYFISVGNEMERLFLCGSNYRVLINLQMKNVSTKFTCMINGHKSQIQW